MLRLERLIEVSFRKYWGDEASDFTSVRRSIPTVTTSPL